MCTSLAVENKESFFFGRTLDLDRDFGDGVVLTPRNYPLRLRCGEVLRRHYAYIGVAALADGYPLYADGMNEFGLCIAGLEFNGNAFYAPISESGKKGITPFELIPYLLARYKSVEEAVEQIEKISLTDVPFSDDIPNSPMHWHIADKSRSVTLEVTRCGTLVYENRFGVLTNNPPFPYHQYNASLYLNISNKTPDSSKFPKGSIFGNGLLAHGMPGDYSSPSRFIKAAWLRECASGVSGLCLSDIFSLLDAVAPPIGAVYNTKGLSHFTRYTGIMDVNSGVYAYKRHGDTKITTTYIKKESLDTETLTISSF